MPPLPAAYRRIGDVSPHPSSEHPSLRAEARVDLDAIRDNVAALRSHAAGDAQVMAVVKADGYGHGLVPAARAALAGGATWLGAALVEEGLALRAAGVGGRILCWLATPGEGQWEAAVRADIDVSVNSRWALDEISAAATAAGRTARVHLKVDTGLGRNGATVGDWPELVSAAVAAQSVGAVNVVGVWSHFALADAPGHPTIRRQVEVFREAVELAESRGVRPEVRHLANSAATLTLPDAHFDLVRPGIAVYGLSPVPREAGPQASGLRPAMTLLGRFALVKRVPAGTGVSYAHAYVTERETTLGLVPMGYADGIPRNASSVGPLLAAGARRTIAGRVCLHLLVADLGDATAAAGDEVLLFGNGEDGSPTAQDWADATDTISYEIVTRVGPRIPRRYVGAHAGEWAGS
jgi:alanine racemase